MHQDSPYQDLQDQRLERLGSGKGIQVDVRVLAATNKDLEQEIQSGNFREDLVYRLKVIAIKLPPLRERGNDIAVLARHFLQYYAREQSKQITEITSRAMRPSWNMTGRAMSGSWRMSLNRQ
ncbi:MAG: sigma 54-interacting transcriptional regulator [Desulfohalobiaceae bacterium]